MNKSAAFQLGVVDGMKIASMDKDAILKQLFKKKIPKPPMKRAPGFKGHSTELKKVLDPKKDTRGIVSQKVKMPDGTYRVKRHIEL